MNYFDSKTFLPKLGWIFILINVVLYIFQIIMMGLWIASDEIKEGNPLYEINIVADVLLSAAISLGFFIYGWLLFFLARNSQDEDFERNKELVRILTITLLFTACFLVRCVMFLYRPITGAYLPTPVFYCFAYFVPECIPCLFQIYLAETSRGQAERDNQYIDDLYAESEDSAKFENSRLVEKNGEE